MLEIVLLGCPLLLALYHLCTFLASLALLLWVGWEGAWPWDLELGWDRLGGLEVLLAPLWLDRSRETSGLLLVGPGGVVLLLERLVGLGRLLLLPGGRE